jgi:hypothetical protein
VTIKLRIVLAACAILMLVFVVRKLRKSALEIVDSIFWTGLAALLIVIALFPELVFWVSSVAGFGSTSNFVFFCGVILMLSRMFTLEIKVAGLKKKLMTLAQTVALKDAE